MVAYFVNHPKYTSPSFGSLQISLGLSTFLVQLICRFSADEGGNVVVVVLFLDQ